MTQNQLPFAAKATDATRIMFGVGGLVAAVLGLLILIFPGKSASFTVSVVAAIVAAYAFVAGVVYLGGAIFSRTKGGWARTGHILLGLLYIIGGIVMAVNLNTTGAVLALFLSITIGVLWLMEGIIALTMLSKIEGKKIWTIIYAIISILAGLTLIMSPLLGAITLWWLIGISMLVLGVMQIIRAFTIKTPADAVEQLMR